MVQARLVVCPQCGKKYQLKEGFSAASFSCKSCGATVWVGGKKKTTPSAKRRGARGRGRGRAGARRAGAPVAARGRRGREPEVGAEGEEGRRPRYQKETSSTNTILAVAGLVIIVGIAIFLVMNRKGDADEKTRKAASGTVTDDGTADGTAAREPAAKKEDATTPAAEDDTTGEAADTDAPEQGSDDAEGSGKGLDKPSKKLGSKPKKPGGLRKSRYDPPADLGHLETTPPDKRKKIDQLIAMMFDPQSGIDGIRAKNQLIAIGKPAFPPILGAMAKVRDVITDVDSHEERLTETSLKLADEALREMDGWLTAKNKSTLRPGSQKSYIAYILRLHYRRWVRHLEKMPRMPGAFDPSHEYEGEAEEYK